MQTQSDPVESVLKKAPLTPKLRADAWDAFEQATDEDDLTARLEALSMPREVKAALWDLKAQSRPADFTAANERDDSGRPMVRRSLTDTAIASLPAVAGMAGSFLGGSKASPVGIALGTLAGGAGEATRQIIDTARGRRDLVPETPLGQLGSIAKEGAIQGGLEVVGRGASGVLKGSARKVYGGVLKAKDAISKNFPSVDVVGEALANRAVITRGGKRAMEAKTSASRADALRLVSEAEQAGAPGVGLRAALSEFPGVVETLRKRADIGMKNELGKVGKRGRALADLVDRNAGAIPLTPAQVYKETAQKAADAAYKKIARGAKGQLSANDLINAATATGLQKDLEQQVVGLAAQNQTTQRLLAVTRALKDAVKRESKNNLIGLRDAIGAGGGVTGYAASGSPELAALIYAVTRITSTPSLGSGAAIGLNELSKMPLSQLLRAAQVALLSQMDQPEAPKGR